MRIARSGRSSFRTTSGGTIGGPILKNRLFFFLSFAEVLTPQSGAYQTLVLTPAAQSGNFSYVGTDGATAR
jgi:hypothetical protein